MTRFGIVSALLITSALGVSRISNGSGGAAGALEARQSGTVVATIHIDPLSVKVDLGTARASSGTGVPATVTASNSLGAVTMLGVSAQIEPISEVAIRPDSLRLLGRIPAGTSKTSVWTLCASTAGTYAIVAYAEGHDRQGDLFAAYSPARLLVVTPGGRARC